MKSIVIFASGSGTNAEKIIEHFRKGHEVKVAAIFTNKAGSGASVVADRYGINLFCFNDEGLKNGSVLSLLNGIKPDLIVLAGFLKLLPKSIIENYPGKILNIHPALLPKYGGKGFYGKFVHEAVLKKKDQLSGITIHFVDDEYDRGEIVLQKQCEVRSNDSVESLAERVRRLEHEHYPETIEKILKNEPL